MILVILIIRDLQNFRLNGTFSLEESGERILDCIGELRYYNHKYLEEGIVKVPRHIKKYRLGLHDPGEKPVVKVVKNKNYFISSR
jgi:hypothetical protein